MQSVKSAMLNGTDSIMLTFAGNNVLTGNEVVIFDHLRMWAERGLIHIEDARNNEYKVVGVREMLERMRAISDMIKNSLASMREKEDQFDSAKLAKDQGMLNAMVEVLRRAQAQGMPSDASARRDLVRRRPKTVVVPGYGGGL